MSVGQDAQFTVAALREAIESQTCPWCGRGPFFVLAQHVQRVHEIPARDLREMAGMFATAKICSDEYSAKASELALEKGWRPPADGPTYPRNLNSAAKARLLEQNQKSGGLWRFVTPEQRSANAKRAALALTPEQRSASAKKAAQKTKGCRSDHGLHRYRRWGCRCPICKEANAADGRKRRSRRRAATGYVVSPRAKPAIPHGTRRGYKRGCRCDDCRRANSEYKTSLVTELKSRQPNAHGLSSYSNYGCRCEVCKQAAAQYRRDRKLAAA